MSVTSTAPSTQHPASGNLGLEPEAFSGRLCPAEPKGAENSVTQTQMSLTEGQRVTEGRSGRLSKPFCRSDQLG